MSILSPILVDRQAKRYYDLIPPYLAHKEDWTKLLPEWVDQAPKVIMVVVVILIMLVVIFVLLMVLVDVAVMVVLLF